jgi:hypothetical protein
MLQAATAAVVLQRKRPGAGQGTGWESASRVRRTTVCVAAADCRGCPRGRLALPPERWGGVCVTACDSDDSATRLRGWRHVYAEGVVVLADDHLIPGAEGLFNQALTNGLLAVAAGLGLDPRSDKPNEAQRGSSNPRRP